MAVVVELGANPSGQASFILPRVNVRSTFLASVLVDFAVIAIV